MFYENLNNLKKKSIPFYNYYRSMKIDEYKTFQFKSRASQVDIYLKGSNKTYLSSLDQKEYEADLLVDSILSGNQNEIIIIGLGNSIFINKLLEKVDQDRKIHIIEFNEVFDIIFRTSDLSKTEFGKISNFLLVEERFEDIRFINRVVDKSNMDFKVFILPQYQRLFPKLVKDFYEVFSSKLKSKKSSLNVNQAYQKLWIYNSIINFKHVISTTNLLDFRENNFEDSVAIVVGAGPSLDFDIDKLRKLSQDNKVYIFAIGSSYKTLVRNGINIDLLFSYDPTKLNQDVLEEYYKKDMLFPLCFGSSIGFESIRETDYKNTFHILTSQDSFSRYLLDADERLVITDAPSIIIIAIQSLVLLGFKKIVFSGINLGYLKGRNYADGIEYNRLAGKNYSTGIMTEDVFGNQIYTMKGYEQTRIIIENYIEMSPDINYINTTNGGAKIKGAPYKPLDEVNFESASKSLKFNEIEMKKSYDLSKVRERFNKLLNEREQFNKYLEEGFNLIYQLKEAIEAKKNYDVNLIIKLEKIYNEICSNDYFNVLISKLERNYISIFENDVLSINREKNMEKKFKLIYKKMGTIFTLFKKNDKKVYELFVYILKCIEWE